MSKFAFTAAHAPLGHAGLPFDSFLPPRHHVHSANARTFFLVDLYEHLHPVVAPALPEVPSTETSQLTFRWPIISMPLPEGPDIAVSVDNFGPLPVTPRGSTYILLFADRFGRRADIFAVIAAEFIAEGTANILINRYIPLWRCPRSILSDNCLQFCSKIRMQSTSFFGFGKLPPAPTTQMAMLGWNV